MASTGHTFFSELTNFETDILKICRSRVQFSRLGTPPPQLVRSHTRTLGRALTHVDQHAGRRHPSPPPPPYEQPTVRTQPGTHPRSLDCGTIILSRAQSHWHRLGSNTSHSKRAFDRNIREAHSKILFVWGVPSKFP